LFERDTHRYSYRLTDKGIRVALMFALFPQRTAGPWPIASSIASRPTLTPQLPHRRPPIKEQTPPFNRSSTTCGLRNYR
jgi:hypothetical protein